MTEKTATPPVPSSDHAGGGDEAALFADVLSSSALLANEVPLPGDSDGGDLEDSADDDLEDADDSTDDEDDDDDNGASLEDETDDDDDSSEEDSTEDDDDSDSDDEGEVDWDFEIPVKIDGEESKVTLEELRKGYQTQQHLSKQGRELGEQKAAFEAEKKTELEKVISTANILAQQVKKAETDLATEYATLKEEMATLKKDGDRYGASDVKDKMEEVQQKYWAAVRDRESLEKHVTESQQQEQEKAFKEEIERFSTEINELIPDFDTDRAKAIRDFAIDEGVPEELINVLASAKAVKFIDDYRLMKETLNKGSAKRKKAPARKVTPTRKATPKKTKDAAKEAQLSKKLASGEASEEEGYNVLLSMASKYV